jgi:hypothetical protein
MRHRLSRNIFNIMQKLGIHVTRNSFYSPIPDTRTLTESLWTRKSEMAGIKMRDDEQLELLNILRSKYKPEYDKFPLDKPIDNKSAEYFIRNGMYGAVDGEIYYSIIRHFKPRKIIEIGCGYSTRLAATAIHINQKENEKNNTEVIAIEPYPEEYLRNGFSGLSKLIEKKVQDIPIEEFGKLGKDDILFIDSSHTLKIGSDVQYEYLEILPRLSEGVLVHIHDIFIPEEYPRKWILDNHDFWNEQYLLQAFMIFNDAYEVMWAGNFMSVKYPDVLESTFLSYERQKTRPGSFWLKKVK